LNAEAINGSMKLYILGRGLSAAMKAAVKDNTSKLINDQQRVVDTFSSIYVIPNY